MEEGLRKRAEEIRDRVGVGKNTAYCIGSYLLDLLTYVGKPELIKELIDISDGFSQLDKYNSIADCGIYLLTAQKRPAYLMMVTSDNSSHVVTQFLYGNSIVDTNGAISGHADGKSTILTRTYNFSAPNLPDIPLGSWGKWKYEHGNYMVDLPESEYERLRDAGKLDNDVYYFTYEDEGV